MRCFHTVGALRCLIPLSLVLTAVQPVAGQEKCCTCVEIQGVLLARQGDKAWQVVKPKENAPAGTLLVSLFSAELQSANGAVGVTLLGDVGQFGPYPVMEAAVRLNDAGNTDLDLTLERGIVILTNKKASGAAKAVLHIRGEAIEVELREPGARLGVEIYGRHAPGLAQAKKDEPATFLFFLTTKGHVVLSTKAHTFGLREPPGPALLKWDSVGRQPEVEHLDKLPETIVRNEKEKAQFAQLCACAHHVSSDVAGSLRKMAQSDNASERLVAITGLGAIDALGGVLAALGDEKHADARAHAIVVLRHWLGREPGQIKKLIEAAKEKKVAAANARTLLQLLLGFDAHAQHEPQTYELLIDLLGHSQLPFRELAHWHLVRLAPAGRNIAYDAAAPAARRQQAIDSWRGLIPPGQLPPEPKKG